MRAREGVGQQAGRAAAVAARGVGLGSAAWGGEGVARAARAARAGEVGWHSRRSSQFHHWDTGSLPAGG